MGRTAKPVEPPPGTYLFVDGEGERFTLLAAKSYIYELNTFVSSSRGFNLDDSTYVIAKQIKTTKLKTYTTTGPKTNKIVTIKEYVLIAAPKKWLKENNYNQIS